MNESFSESVVHERLESQLHEFAHPFRPPTLTSKILHQEKCYPGIYPFWSVLNPLIQKYNAGTLTHDERLDFRRFFKQKVSEYSGQSSSYGAVTFGVTDTLEGDGNAPQTTGYPSSDSLTWEPVAPYAQYYNSFVPNFFGIGGQSTVLDACTASVAHYTGFPPGGLQPPDPVYPLIELTETLSDEPTFSALLSTCVTRLNARVFTGVSWGDWSFERFNEYKGGYVSVAELDPGNYDGQPETATAEEIAFPELVIQQLGGVCNPIQGQTNYAVASYWFWPEWERSSALMGYGANRIIAERVQFRITNTESASYWIGYSVLKSEPGTACTIHGTVKVIATGTLGYEQSREVEFPYALAYDGAQDFVDLGGGEISCGAVCFAILNETPEHWSSRTGFAVEYP